MYYNDFAKVRRVEKLLEKLAYFSIILDIFLATATYLVIRGALTSDNFILAISDILVFAEVALALVLFGLLMLLKHYKKVLDGLDKVVFRTRHKRWLAAFGVK